MTEFFSSRLKAGLEGKYGLLQGDLFLFSLKAFNLLNEATHSM
jgi:hypothetical protein